MNDGRAGARRRRWGLVVVLVALAGMGQCLAMPAAGSPPTTTSNGTEATPTSPVGSDDATPSDRPATPPAGTSGNGFGSAALGGAAAVAVLVTAYYVSVYR